MTFKRTFHFLILVCAVLSCKQRQADQPYVVLISIDGFRHDYAEKYQANNILAIAKRGVKSKSLVPCFPTKTFPNHYSIVTGMYPESHGLVANYFYDPSINDYYLANKGEKVTDGKWYGGKPLWNLANENQLKSATYFWIGSEAEINNDRPTYYNKFDDSIGSDQIVDQTIDWLKLPLEDRPHFVSAYFSAVDHAGHDYGVDSPELENAVKEIDEQIGRLNRTLSRLDIPVNIVIVSDHGMTNLNTESPIYYEDFTDLENVKYITDYSHLMIYSEDSNQLKSIYDSLLSNENGKYRTYLKRDIPSQYHFKNNNRTGDILVVANPSNIFSPRGKQNSVGGHGFDPSSTDMHGMFIATGPDITQSDEIASFENIHIYPFIADLLNIPYDTASIDGDAKVLQTIIKK